MRSFHSCAIHAYLSRSTPLALLVLGACVQPPEGTPATTEDSSTTASDTTASNPSTDDATDTSASDGSGSTTGAALEDPCLAFPPDACPAGCSPIPTYPYAENACGVGLVDELVVCVSTGEPLDPDTPPTTFHAEIDGEVRYFLVNQPCVTTPAVAPADWTECTTASGAPEACKCMCGADGCPYEAELLLLEACGLDDPCGPAPINDAGEPVDHDRCVYAALRDRIPGTYGAHSVFAFAESESHVFFDGSEEVQLVYRNASLDTCWSALNGTWEPTLTCTLKPPEWFDACIADPTPGCLHGLDWVDGCEEQPASCP